MNDVHLTLCLTRRHGFEVYVGEARRGGVVLERRTFWSEGYARRWLAAAEHQYSREVCA